MTQAKSATENKQMFYEVKPCRIFWNLAGFEISSKVFSYLVYLQFLDHQ